MTRQHHTIRRQSDLPRILGTQLADQLAQLGLPRARRLPASLVLGENSGALLVGPGDELRVFLLSRKGGVPVLLATEHGSDNMADFYRPAGNAADHMPASKEVLVFVLLEEAPEPKQRRWTATVAFGAAVKRPKAVAQEDAPVRGI